MSKGERSFEQIAAEDLERLAHIAITDQQAMFRRNPDIAAVYSSRLLCVALCQGAALHYLDGKTGVKDFDVWSFYRESDDRPFPRRRPRVVRDFGDPKFGRGHTPSGLVGRRVDILAKSIRVPEATSADEAVRQYLRAPKTKTAALLAKKAAIAIHPDDMFGLVLWPER